MTNQPNRTAAKTHADCEQAPRPRDGAQAWLGVVIIVMSAATTAALLGYAVWHWASP